MLSHSLTNFEKQTHYQNEGKINGVYSRINLHKIKDEAYVLIFAECKSIGTHWIALKVYGNNRSAS